jgi:TonB family protein
VRKALLGSLICHAVLAAGYFQWIAVTPVKDVTRRVYEVKLVGAVETANAQAAPREQPAPPKPEPGEEKKLADKPSPAGVRKAAAKPDSETVNSHTGHLRMAAVTTDSRFAIDAPAQENPAGKAGPTSFDDIDARVSSSSPALHITHPGSYSETYIILHAVQPQYPEHERERSIEGSVTVELLVDEQGLVANANVLELVGPESFRRSALEAVRQFEFQAPIENGVPSTMWIKFVIKFQIHGLTTTGP